MTSPATASHCRGLLTTFLCRPADMRTERPVSAASGPGPGHRGPFAGTARTRQTGLPPLKYPHDHRGPDRGASIVEPPQAPASICSTPAELRPSGRNFCGRVTLTACPPANLMAPPRTRVHVWREPSARRMRDRGLPLAGPASRIREPRPRSQRAAQQERAYREPRQYLERPHLIQSPSLGDPEQWQ